MADLDIEETNRLRAALGMAPLPTGNNSNNLRFKTGASKADDSDSDDPGSTLETREAAAGGNWQKLEAEAKDKQRREERKAKLKKERDAAQRFAKLEGKGLGDADGDEVDTRSWLLGTQKRQKKLEKQRAKMLQQELEERENQAQYTEKDLKGAKVAHELGAFDEEGEHILTLKDAAIGDESEDDELENTQLRALEQANERNKLKLKKPQYDPNAEENEGGQSLLGKYDEEISGKKKKHFTLDGLGRTEEEAHGNDTRGGPQGMQFTLDLPLDDKPTSDYVDISEIKIKKPKKQKKEKTKRRKDEDDEDIFAVGESRVPAINTPDAMDVEPQPTNGANKRRREDTSFADDEDLQSSLANQRKSALKKRKRAGPEELARQLREEASEAPDAMDTNEEEGLVIDETSEFLSTLQKPKAPEDRQASSLKLIKRSASDSKSPAPPGPDGEGDVAMKDEGSSDEDNMQDNRHFKPEPSPGAPAPHTATGLADEETFTNAGLGATLGMLSQRGLIKNQGGEGLAGAHSRQAQFIAHKERLEKEWNEKAASKRKRDRDAGIFERMTKRQQEEYAQNENKMRDQYVSRQLDELFNKEYKPNVELKYVDEFGRHMGSREAFKQMSHQFHGKGSGKQKTEKRLKKIEEEKAREAKSSLDSSQAGGMDRAGQTQAKRNRQAGVRLQ